MFINGDRWPAELSGTQTVLVSDGPMIMPDCRWSRPRQWGWRIGNAVPEGLSSSWIIAGKRLTKPRQYKQSSAQRMAVVACRLSPSEGRSRWYTEGTGKKSDVASAHSDLRAPAGRNLRI